MSKAWVTGASGFIGRHTARELSRRGYRVAGIGLDPWDEPSESWGVESWIQAPIGEAALDRLGEDAGAPDAVVHLAGGSSVGASMAAPLGDFKRSVPPTAVLLEWLRMNAPGARVVFASSAAVYGAGHSQPIPVLAPPDPFSPYGFHKRMGELLCESYARSYDVRSTVVRLFSVYGPGLRKQLLWDLCQKLSSADRRVTLAGTGREVRDWVDVRVAAGFLVDAIAEAEMFAIRNGGTGRGVDVASVAKFVVEHWGSGAEIVFSGERRTGDPHYLVAEMPSEVSGSPGIAEGAGEYVDWFRGARR